MITTSCEYERESCQKVVKKWLSKYIISLSYSLSSFFSLHCFRPMKTEKMKVVIKVVQNGCTYITNKKLNTIE
jgi:hypothetical protein